MLSFQEKYPNLVAIALGSTVEDTLPGITAEEAIDEGAEGFFVVSVAAGRAGMASYLAEPVELKATEDPNVFSSTFPVAYPSRTGVEATVTADIGRNVVTLSANSAALSKLVVAVAYGPAVVTEPEE